MERPALGKHRTQIFNCVLLELTRQMDLGFVVAGFLDQDCTMDPPNKHWSRLDYSDDNHVSYCLNTHALRTFLFVLYHKVRKALSKQMHGFVSDYVAVWISNRYCYANIC